MKKRAAIMLLRLADYLKETAVRLSPQEAPIDKPFFAQENDTTQEPTMENKQLYASVKASFVAKHSSLHKWCLARGIHRQNARAALLGDWTGGKATELRKLLIEEAGIEADGSVDAVELAHEPGGGGRQSAQAQ